MRYVPDIGLADGRCNVGSGWEEDETCAKLSPADLNWVLFQYHAIGFRVARWIR